MRLITFVFSLVLSFSASAFDSQLLYTSGGDIIRDGVQRLSDELTRPQMGRIMQKAIDKGRPIEGGAYLYAFENYTTLYQCGSHPIWSAQLLGADAGNVDRSGKNAYFFTIDDNCAPTSTDTFRPYQSTAGEIKYHRGHLLSFNANDGDSQSAMASNAMVNIVPQSATLNLGAYRYTEELEECYREKEGGIFVVAGGIDKISSDNIQDSMNTPEYIFKIVVRLGPSGTSRYQAWMFPNDNRPTKSSANNYLISINQLESYMSWPLPVEVSELVPAEQRRVKPEAWDLTNHGAGRLSCAGTIASGS